MSYNSPFTGNVIQPTDVSYRGFTIAANTQLAWPINGNPTGNYAARIMEVTASAANLQLRMPPADQASVGQDALIRNTGANSFTVYDFDGQNTIVTVAAGQAQYIYITDNPDESGTWGIIAFGIGSSGANAATLAGFGLLAVGSTLNQSHPISELSNNYTISTNDRAETLNWIGGAGTFTLNSASDYGDNWFTLIRNSGTGALTVATNGSDFLNGSTTLLFQEGDSAILVSSGLAFFTVGYGKNTQFNFTQLTKPVVTGTYTLTSAEASNVIIRFTGTLTGNVTVVVPPTIQVYYIQNSTDGTVSNYTVTVTTGVAGSATAIISQNQQTILVCDSVNMLAAVTQVSGSNSLSMINGAVATPALFFAAEPSTGVYRSGVGRFDISILGVQRSRLEATGLSITGVGVFSSGVQGGAF